MPDQHTRRNAEAGPDDRLPKGINSPPLASVPRDAVVRGSAAVRALIDLELALEDLAAVEPRSWELAMALAIARERLRRHYLAPYAAIIEEHGFAA